MALSPGVTLGNFEIIAPLGAGGMGEVYRARDTRLQRDVALKLLPETFASDPDRIARFEREAHTLAALNHPHIAQVYGFERGESSQALVMELVEGDDLSQLIARGRLPLDEALPIARQIADALEAAHDAGIIHRDLKPANIKVRPDGTVKVLDFGLAKALDQGSGIGGQGSGELGNSPTITSPAQMTHAGMILGTAAYMSPEQARGRVVDRRTDVWAFGCVLFEMLTGTRAFSGDDVTETLASIMKSDPPMARLSPDTPVEIRRLLTRCLQKDRRLRLQHIGDARLELDDAAHLTPTPATPTVSVRPEWRLWLGVAAMAVAALGAGIGLSEWRHARQPVTAMQFAIVPPPQVTFGTPPSFGTGVSAQFAISPDGRTIVFVADSGKGFQLWHRPLSAVDAQALPGTDGATFPFWSPDSRSVGFFADGKLKRIRIDGGPPLIICDAVSGRGGTWNSDNVIVFDPSTSGPLQRVSAGSGVPQDISKLDADYGESNHRWPFFLPDGKHFLYTATVGTCCPAVKPARIKIGALDSTDTETLMSVESSVIFANGHLLYADRLSGTLMAQPFDANGRKLLGEPFAVAVGLTSEGSRYASLSASTNGVLVHARGESMARRTSRLTWFDRTGSQPRSVGDPGTITSLSLSSDDQDAVVSIMDPQTVNRDIHLIDTARNTQTRISFDPGEDYSPMWFPNRPQILFVGRRGESQSILSKAIGLATKEQLVFSTEAGYTGTMFVNDISVDGKLTLIQRARQAQGQQDVWVLREGERTAEPYLQTPANEQDAAFSPDAKWIAYQSNDVGQRPHVYVQPYPATGATFQISREASGKPLWSSNGKELFFLTDEALMSSTIETTDGFQSGAPRLLFAANVLAFGANPGRQYGVTRDGQHFLINLPQRQLAPQALTVTANWLAAARKD